MKLTRKVFDANFNRMTLTSFALQRECYNDDTTMYFPNENLENNQRRLASKRVNLRAYKRIEIQTRLLKCKKRCV